MMKTYAYKQTTYETCLACSLLHLCAIKSSRAKELEIWRHGWNFNFLIGQLNFVVSKYKQKLGVIIESRHYYKDLQKQINKDCRLENKSISVALIRRLAKKAPLIVYVDNFFFNSKVHAPHFVTVLGIEEGKYLTADSWDGAIQMIEPEQFEKAINSLRSHLLFSPVLIYKI